MVCGACDVGERSKWQLADRMNEWWMDVCDVNVGFSKAVREDKKKWTMS